MPPVGWGGTGEAKAEGCGEGALHFCSQAWRTALVTGSLVEKGVLTPQTMEGLARGGKGSPSLRCCLPGTFHQLMLTLNKAMFSLGLGNSPGNTSYLLH